MPIDTALKIAEKYNVISSKQMTLEQYLCITLV